MTRILAILAIAPAALAHDTITTKLLWTQEISRLMNRHCVSCHRPGGVAMSLATYDDARPWAKAVRDEVTSRRMPPWGPVKGVGEFRNDPSLSQIEIDMMVNWVEGGAPKGDDVYLPPAPQFGKDESPREPPGRELMIQSGAPIVLPTPAEFVAIQPVKLAAGEPMEVTAYLPDGAVRHLIWVRHWRPEWERTYYFLDTVKLPRNTRIAVYSSKSAGAAIFRAQ